MRRLAPRARTFTFTFTFTFAFAFAACQRDNAAYCDAVRACGADSMCNLATNQCEPVTMFDLSVADLVDGGGAEDLTSADMVALCMPACVGLAPICVGTSCLGCDTIGDGEQACASATPATPHCLTSGPSQGACAQCRTSADCSGATSSCDPNDHVCRACVTDGDCASKACDLTYGSPTQFTCKTNVIYVDCQNGKAPPTNDGKSLGSPLLLVSQGVAAAKSAGYDTVRVTGNCAGENLTVDNANLTLIGDTGAAIKQMNNNNPALLVSGSSNLVVRNFLITGGAGGNNGHGIQCTASNGSLTVLDCVINGNLQYGIDANMCGKLTVERSIIGGSSVAQPNSAGGIRIGKAFHIVNNFIVHNGATTNSGGGVVINSMSNVNPANFVNNTVADNTGSGINAGVSCANTITITNNILYNNKLAATPSESNCTLSYCATDDGLNSSVVNLAATPPLFVGGDDYHLQPSSPCVDKGTNLGFPAHDYDKQPRPDPKTGKVDIGADEVE